jgi:hypothetical protein
MEIVVVSTCTVMGTRDWVQVPKLVGELEEPMLKIFVPRTGAAEAAVANEMPATSVNESSMIIEYTIEERATGAAKACERERKREG